MKTTIALLLPLALLGCAEPTGSNAIPQMQKSKVYPQRSPNDKNINPKLFSWGASTIKIGMTKMEVIEQIRISGWPEYGNLYGISMPSKAMQQLDRWDLSYGNASGAAPGGGAIAFIFKEDRLSDIVLGYSYA